MRHRIRPFPCLGIPNRLAYIIVETDAQDIGFRVILEQKLHNKEELFCFHLVPFGLILNKITLLLEKKFYL